MTKTIKLDDFTYNKLKAIAKRSKNTPDNIVADLIINTYISMESDGAFAN